MRIALLIAATLAATALTVGTTAGPACAHNSLTKAVPGKNATVKKSPAKIELTFLQKVDAESMTIAVTDSDNRKVPSGEAEADGKKARLPITGELTNGTYKVSYRVVSPDGHPVQGSYLFAVFAPGGDTKTEGLPPSRPASPDPAVSSAAPGSSAAPATVAAADSSDDGPGWGLIVGIMMAVAALVTGGFLLARRRKTIHSDRTTT